MATSPDINTKMKTYQIAGKAYAVIGEELYEKVLEFGALS